MTVDLTGKYAAIATSIAHWSFHIDLRYSRTLSEPGSLSEDDQQAIADAISEGYVRYVREPKKAVIYQHEPSVHISDGGVEGSKAPECWCEDPCKHTGIRWGDINKRLVTETSTQEFDFVSALTQHGINAHYKYLWESAQLRYKMIPDSAEGDVCLYSYTLRDPQFPDTVFFTSKFETPQIQLRVGERSVLFYLNLKEGLLKTLGAQNTLDSE